MTSMLESDQLKKLRKQERLKDARKRKFNGLNIYI